MCTLEIAILLGALFRTIARRKSRRVSTSFPLDSGFEGRSPYDLGPEEGLPQHVEITNVLAGIDAGIASIQVGTIAFSATARYLFELFAVILALLMAAYRSQREASCYYVES